MARRKEHTKQRRDRVLRFAIDADGWAEQDYVVELAGQEFSFRGQLMGCDIEGIGPDAHTLDLHIKVLSKVMVRETLSGDTKGKR